MNLKKGANTVIDLIIVRKLFVLNIYIYYKFCWDQNKLVFGIFGWYLEKLVTVKRGGNTELFLDHLNLGQLEEVSRWFTGTTIIQLQSFPLNLLEFYMFLNTLKLQT